jgi:hypothetical protein
MHCINISHPDFVTLKSESSIPLEILKTKVSVWMDQNQNIDRFPTIEELTSGSSATTSDILYSKPKLNTYQKKAADIFWNYVYNKDLSERDVAAIDRALLQISQQIGDVDWHLRLSKNNTYYIAGYKNSPVTMEDYYSPHANGMFRQMSSTAKEGPIENLNKKLYAWAKSHGISIQAMDQLIERFEGRYSNTALGVADFANALIGLAENQKIDTLPEEVAHFAIEIMLGDPSIQRALETVSDTEMYAKVKEDYKDVYTNEIDFRKEALGKLLAQEILDTYNGQQRQAPRGFFAYLKAAAEKFLGWVQNFMNKRSPARVELDAVIKPLAISILDNRFMGKFGETNNSQTNKLYQLPQDEDEETPEPVVAEDPIIINKKKFLAEVVLQLSDRMGLLRRSARSNVTIANLESEINRLEHMLAEGELDLAISGFISLATTEIGILDKNLKKMRETQDINPTTLVMSENFMQMYENIFANFIETMNDFGIPLEETEEFRKMIHNLAVQISETRGINTVLLKKVTRETLDKANTDEYGNKIDPTFDPGLMAEETHEDVSTWRFLVGNYKYSDSKIIKAAHKIIFNAIGNVRRYAAQRANNILEAQELMFRAGGKIEDLIELNEDGKPTHYFIREYQWGKYYAEMDKTKQAIVEALGVERYEDVKREFLTKEQLTQMGNLWKDFFKENTIKGQVTLEDGTSMETTLPNNSYRNPRFDEVMKNPATKEYYDRLIKLKRESLEKLPVQYRSERMVYMVPPILKSTIDRLTNKEENFFARIAKLGREALFVENDETQFGQLNVLNNKMVPIHFTRALDDIKDLSYDVTRSVVLFAEMAENFREMNKIAGDLGSLQYTLAERNYFTDKKHTRRKKGIETTEYQALELLLDTHIFGIERDAKSFTVPKNSMTEKLGIADKQFSWTKASQRFAKFIRNNNLAFNFITSTSGWLKGSGDSIIEDQIGIYTTNESKNWARLEFSKNLFQVIGELGKARQTNKMHLILQEADIIDLEKTLYESNKNRGVRRILNQDVMYTTFATGDYGIKGRITLAIYDNYRLYKGQFMTRAKFYEKTAAEQNVTNDKKHQKAVSKEWKSLQEKSLYNAHEVVDGQLKVRPEFEQYVTPGVLNSARGKIEQVTTSVDGTMSKTDKGKLSRTMAGDFVLMHRGWFIGMMDTRFRREGMNMMTEEEEIGTYRATAGFIYNAFYKTLIKDRAGLQASFGTWKTLSPAKKRGVMKTALDFLYLNIAAFVAGLANVAADDADDDDWTAQYLAYQLNRVLLEQGAAWSPAELINMIDEPVVGARMIKDLADMKEAFNFGEVYESGMYEDKSHAKKWWMKKLPTRNIYEMQFPDLKNQFIKTMVDSRYYEWMTPEQGHSVAKKGGFWDWLLPSGLGSDESTRAENVQIIYQDLEAETEEDNGLN